MSGHTITTQVTISRGQLVASARITNPQALAGVDCRAGRARTGQPPAKRGPSVSFARRTLTARVGGSYAFSLAANPIAKTALARGRTLRIRERLTLTATHVRKAMHKTFNVILRGATSS